MMSSVMSRVACLTHMSEVKKIRNSNPIQTTVDLPKRRDESLLNTYRKNRKPRMLQKARIRYDSVDMAPTCHDMKLKKNRTAATRPESPETCTPRLPSRFAQANAAAEVYP